MTDREPIPQAHPGPPRRKVSAWILPSGRRPRGGCANVTEAAGGAAKSDDLVLGGGDRASKALRPGRVRRCALKAVVVASGLAAPAAHAESLADVIAYTYQVNPGVQAQRAALRALDESYVAARGAYGPSVNVSVGTTDYTDRRSGAQAHADTTNAALSVVQPVYSGGRAISRVREAEADIKAGRQTLRRTEIDLLQRAVAAYVGVRRDEQILKIAGDTVAVLDRELHATQSRFDVREVTRTDLSQAQARLAQARTQLLTAQAQLGASRAQFLGVVGRPPGSLEPPPAIDALPPNAEAAFDAAEANNPQLQGARDTEMSSRAAVAAAKAEHMPSVTARFDDQRAPFAPYLPSPYDNVRSASLTLTLPLFAGGQIASGVRRSIEANNRDRLNIDDTRLGVLQQVSTAWEQVVALRQQLSTAQEEMRADLLAFAGARQEQKVALRSTIEVLNAALELSNAEQNVARVRSAEYTSRVDLLAVMGVLTPQTLSPATTTYDPSQNFRKVENLGVTPLELPIRLLDGLTAPRPHGEPPASLDEARPPAPDLPPRPTEPELPIVSIYSTIEAAPQAKPDATAGKSSASPR